VTHAQGTFFFKYKLRKIYEMKQRTGDRNEKNGHSIEMSITEFVAI